MSADANKSVFSADPIHSEFERLHGIEPEPAPPEFIPVPEVLAEVGADSVELRELAAVLESDPVADRFAPHAEPTTPEQLRENVEYARLVKSGLDAHRELRDRDLDDLLNEALTALEEYEEDLPAKATELWDATGPNDERFVEFWTQFADEDPDGAQEWIQHQTTLEQMRSRSHELEQALELERQAQAAAQAHHDTVAKGIEAAKARHKDWDALTPIMQALANAGAVDAAVNVETVEEAEQLGDGIYRSAREVRRAKEEADFLTAFRATGAPSMSEGFHSAQNEPDWDRIPVVDPKLRVRNVRPIAPPEKRVSAFQAALLDDPVHAEFQRTISKSQAVKKLGKGKR